MGDHPSEQPPTDPRRPGRPVDPEPSPDRRWLIALGAAVAVVAIVLAGWYLTRGSGSPDTAAPPSSPSTTASPTPTPTPTVTVTDTPTPSAPLTACDPAVLEPSVATDGGAAGTTYYALLLRNTGPAACLVAGHPTLTGVTSGGTQTPIQIADTIDGAQAEKYAIGPGGAVQPGAQAGILFAKTSDPSNCPAGSATYETLQVGIGNGVVSLPYPADLAPVACLRGMSDVGPLASP